MKHAAAAESAQLGSMLHAHNNNRMIALMIFTHLKVFTEYETDLASIFIGRFGVFWYSHVGWEKKDTS